MVKVSVQIISHLAQNWLSRFSRVFRLAQPVEFFDDRLCIAMEKLWSLRLEAGLAYGFQRTFLTCGFTPLAERSSTTVRGLLHRFLGVLLDHVAEQAASGSGQG